MNIVLRRFPLLAGLVMLTWTATTAGAGSIELADPDGKPADLSRPVKVFIIMGQSNTLEMGNVSGEKDGSLTRAVQEEGLYPFLIDEEGNWTIRNDVRNVSVSPKGDGGHVYRNEWLSVRGKKKIGIEIGIGYTLGAALDEPVMILKSSIGNRSLGWDLLPPGSERAEFTHPKDGKTYVYPGYRDEVRHSRWEKGVIPEEPRHNWYAGKQFDDDVANARRILENLSEYYPGATKYEIAGFFWWQGDKDRYDAGHASMYERNLANLIRALRREFNAPEARFVCATLGQTDKDTGSGNEKRILDAMMAVSDATRYPDFAGNVATVYTHPLSMGSSSNAHYGGNAKTYMNVGLSMGQTMVKLLKK